MILKKLPLILVASLAFTSCTGRATNDIELGPNFNEELYGFGILESIGYQVENYDSKKVKYETRNGGTQKEAEVDFDSWNNIVGHTGFMYQKYGIRTQILAGLYGIPTSTIGISYHLGNFAIGYGHSTMTWVVDKKLSNPRILKSRYTINEYAIEGGIGYGYDYDTDCLGGPACVREWEYEKNPQYLLFGFKYQGQGPGYIGLTYKQFEDGLSLGLNAGF